MDLTHQRSLEGFAATLPALSDMPALSAMGPRGGFRRIAQELVEDLNERGNIDIREAFIDDSFAPAKKGVLLSAR